MTQKEIFANVLIGLRKERDIPQQKLADDLGVSRTTIGMYETAKREPDFETLVKLAQYFNVDVGVFHGKPDNTTFTQWDKKYNPNGDLAEEIAGIEELCNTHKLTGGGGNISVQFDETNISALLKAIYDEQTVKLIEAFTALNQTGKDEALERITELSELPRYSK